MDPREALRRGLHAVLSGEAQEIGWAKRLRPRIWVASLGSRGVASMQQSRGVLLGSSVPLNGDRGAQQASLGVCLWIRMDPYW